jgi:hypothetical protein
MISYSPPFIFSEIADLLRHRYIRTGETLILSDWQMNVSKVCIRVEGWGRFAAVLIPCGGAVRRDGIRRDADGNWFYRFVE